jgi:hypothetical protein
MNASACWLIAITASTAASAQHVPAPSVNNYRVEVFATDDGLRSQSISDIAEASDGFYGSRRAGSSRDSTATSSELTPVLLSEAADRSSGCAVRRAADDWLYLNWEIVTSFARAGSAPVP